MKPRRLKLAGLLLAIIGLLYLAGTAAYFVSERAGMAAMRAGASHRLDLFAAAIDGVVNRYAHIPGTIELNEHIVAAVRQPGNARLARAADRYLASLNERIGSIAIFVMGLDGVTLAASNWDGPDSFVGDNYAFRPYFQIAARGGESRYYAIGTTQGDPGYFVSHPIRDGGKVLGVAVIKIGLSALERSWLKLDVPALIADSNGVVILASVPEWKFTALTPLGQSLLEELERTRQFNLRPIGQFPVRVEEDYGDQAQVVSFDRRAPPASGVPPGSGRYLAQSRALPESGWRLMVFSDLQPIRNQAYSHAALAGVATSFVALLLLFVNQRRRNLRQRLETQALLERANAELEQKVLARTADLTSANARLQAEVAERQRAEQTLRAAQDELVQAAKLAVLGQMATGITHELTQPLGAVRTLSGNAVQFLRRGDLATAQANLEIIGKLTDQMGGIIMPLKTFARKSPAHPRPVDVCHAVGNALFLLDQRLRREGIELRNRCAPGAVIAQCDQNRLEQVLINLVGNAADAMSGGSRRVLTIDARYSAGGRVEIAVGDSGPGLGEDTLVHLFEPFFTTKPAGEGLGLGLAISRDIVREFGGELRGENGDAGGAVFVVELVAAPEEKAE